SLKEELLKGPIQLSRKLHPFFREPLSTHGDTIILKDEYGEGDFIYNNKNGTIVEDTNSIDPKIRQYIMEERREIAVKERVEKSKAPFPQRRKQLPYFILSIILINGLLIWLARKPKRTA